MKIKIAMLSLLLVSAPMLASAQPKTYVVRGALIGAGVGGAGGLATGLLAAAGGDGLARGFTSIGGEEESLSAGDKARVIVPCTLIGAGVGAGIGALIGLAVKRKPEAAFIQPYVLPTKTGTVAGLTIGKTF